MSIDFDSRHWLVDLYDRADKKHASAKQERLHYAAMGRSLPDDHRIPAEISAVLYDVNHGLREVESLIQNTNAKLERWEEAAEKLLAYDYLLQIEHRAALTKEAA